MAKPDPDLPTLRHRIAWSYANLARAHAALNDGAKRYATVHHVIRARLFGGLRDGTMAMRSLYDDERLKLTLPRCCAYCGAADDLTLDHLIPRLRDGSDAADNLVCACRSCNSSKGARDLMDWMDRAERFPAVYVLRRYLKLAAGWSDRNALLDVPFAIALEASPPFAAEALPRTFPPLSSLALFVRPAAAEGEEG
jgi:5-methylcytosine-specific restriction endonuclease McrA